MNTSYHHYSLQSLSFGGLSHLVIKYWNTYNVPGTILGTGDAKMSLKDPVLSRSLHLTEGK